MNRAGITRRRLLPLLLAPLAGVRPASAQDFPAGRSA